MDIDLNRITIDEYTQLSESIIGSPESKVLMAKVCGVTVGEIGKLGFMDYRKLARDILKKAMEPLVDPN